MRVLGLSLVIIGLLLVNIILQFLLWGGPLEENTYANFIIYCVALIIAGIIISVAGYMRPQNKPLTEKGLKEILRSEEFNTTEILYRVLVEQKDS